jgi:hypothetical protein
MQVTVVEPAYRRESLGHAAVGRDQRVQARQPKVHLSGPQHPDVVGGRTARHGDHRGTRHLLGDAFGQRTADAPVYRPRRPGGQPQVDLVDLGLPGATDEQPPGGQEHRPPAEH